MLEFKRIGADRTPVFDPSGIRWLTRNLSQHRNCQNRERECGQIPGNCLQNSKHARPD